MGRRPICWFHPGGSELCCSEGPHRLSLRVPVAALRAERLPPQVLAVRLFPHPRWPSSCPPPSFVAAWVVTLSKQPPQILLAAISLCPGCSLELFQEGCGELSLITV